MIKEKQEEKDIDEIRSKLVVKASIIGFISNIFLAVIKIIIGRFSNSVSIISDAINNLSDSISSIVTVVGLKIGEKHPTENHPLGYGRFEYISSLVISSIILFSGFEFLQLSFKRVFKPQTVKYSRLYLYILIGTMIVKIALGKYNTKTGKMLKSESLIASGKDAFMDVTVTLATIISMLVSKIFEISIDGYVGLLVSLFIIYSGIELIKITLHDLIGEKPDEKLVDKIENTVSKYKDVMGAHDLMLHSYGPTLQYGSMDLEFPDYLTIEEAYEIMVKAHDEIFEKHGVYMTFGIYSVNTYDKEIDYLRLQVKEFLMDELEEVLNIHAFNLDKEEKIMRFDVVVDFTVHDYDDYILQVKEVLEKRFGEYSFEIDIDLEYA